MIKKKKKSVHIILLGRKPHWCTPGMCPFPDNAVAFEQSATAFPSFPFHDAFSFRLYKIFSIFFPHKVAIRNYYSFLVTFSPTFTFSCQVSHAVLYMYTNLLGKIAAGLGSTAESAAGQLKIYFGKKISMQKSLFMLMSTGPHVGTEFLFRLLFHYHHETVWVLPCAVFICLQDTFHVVMLRTAEG